MIIYAATKNKGKIKEINEILQGSGIECRVFQNMLDVEETGTTFEENASLKADTLSAVLKNEYVISDDSGLCVDALDGMPGIYSARYAGSHGDDKANNIKLLKDMENEINRNCKFVCVIALSINGKTEQLFKGELSGTLAYDEKGENGFGYDPLFITQNGMRTAELKSEEKNKISHRYKALSKLKEYLINL